MTSSSLVAFLLTTILIDLTPGPAVVKVVGDALGNGWQRAQASVAGILLGNVLCCLLSLLGLNAFLLASPVMFELIKWIGAAYLCWLGAQAIWKLRSTPGIMSRIAPQTRTGTMFRSSLVVQSFNPKSVRLLAGHSPAQHAFTLISAAALFSVATMIVRTSLRLR